MTAYIKTALVSEAAAKESCEKKLKVISQINQQ